MKCHEVREQLSTWLDGELAEEDGAALAEHLDKCEACQREWRRLRALESALGQLTAMVPAGLTEKVTARLQPPRRWTWWRSVAMAACLVIGIALGGIMAHGFHAPTVPDGTMAEEAGLEVFHDFPQGSMGTVVVSYHPDEGNGTLP